MAENMFCKGQVAVTNKYRNEWERIFSGIKFGEIAELCHNPTCEWSTCCPPGKGCPKCCSHLHLGEDTLLKECNTFSCA